MTSPKLSVAKLMLVLLAIALQESLHSQTMDPMRFFPHHQGDIWEYWESTGDSSQNRILVDSLGFDGRYVLVTTEDFKLIVDTTTYRVYWRDLDHLRYQLDADSGSVWTVHQDSIARITARVMYVRHSTVFGSKPVTIKVINFYGYGVGGSDSLLMNTDYLASDFGLIGEDQDTFPVRRIKGTSIGGVVHGMVTGVEQSSTSLPEKVSVSQNYPNPFNPSTTISFSIPKQSHVTLKVFDILGREVVALLDETKSVGSYSVMFDTNSLPSGVYFYRVQAGEFIQTKKMLVMR